MNISHFFIDRPIFAAVISIIITLVGAVAYFSLPVAQYPDIAPPSISVTASYPGASAEIVAKTVATPLEQEVNGVDNMLYMTSQSTSDGEHVARCHLQARHQSRYRTSLGAEPRLDGVAAASRGGPLDRRDGDQAVARPDDGDPSLVARRLARPALHFQLRDTPREGRARPHRRRRQRHHLRRARLLDAHLARSREARSAQPDGWRRGQCAACSERAGCRRCHQPASGAKARRLPAQCRDARATHRARVLRQHHHQVRRSGARHPRARRRPRRARRRRLQPQRLSRRAGGHSLGYLSAARLQRARHRGSRAESDGRSIAILPRRAPLRHRLQPDRLHLAIGRSRDPDHVRGRGPRRSGDHPLPADLARIDHPYRRDSRVADRHLRHAGGARLLAEQSFSVRSRARHRHRGRRCHRRGGERRAQHPRRVKSARRRLPNHGGGGWRADRYRARALGRVHPLDFPDRYSRPVLPPIRRNHCHRDGDLPDRVADLEPRALRAPVQGARARAQAPERLRAAGDRLLQRLQSRLRVDLIALRRADRKARPHLGPHGGDLSRPDRADRLPICPGADRASSRSRTRAI